MRGWSIPGVAVAVALATVVVSAEATTVLPLSLSDLVERSDIIALVQVGEVQIVQREETPFRVTRLRVLEAFAGAERNDVLELWQRGDGNIFVIGDPWLESDQEGLAFFRRVEGRIYFTALAQSFWWIEGQGDEKIARRDLSQLKVVPFGAPRVMPANRIEWTQLRQMVLDECMGMIP